MPGELAPEVARQDLRPLRDVELATVRRHRDDDVVRPEPEHLGAGDRGEDVADGREPEVTQRVQDAGRDASAGEVGQPLGLVDHDLEVVGRPVAHRGDEVVAHHVVDQRHVLVADALDVVLAEAVLEQGRALEGLGGEHLGAVDVLEVLTGGDGAGGTGGARHQGEPEVPAGVTPVGLEDVREGRPGDRVVHEVVPELGELVEHEVAGVLARKPVALVVDLLDVRLGADGADDVLDGVLAPAVEPVEALLAHPGRQDRHAAAREEPAHRDAAARVVPGRGPDGTVDGGVELPRHHSGRQAAVGGQHLVRGDHGEAVAEHDEDRAVDAGELAGQHHVVGHVDPAAGPVVVPVHPPQVPGVRGLGVGVADAGLRHGSGVGQLGKGRQDDPPLTQPLHGVGQHPVVEHVVGESELGAQRLVRVEGRGVEGGGRPHGASIRRPERGGAGWRWRSPREPAARRRLSRR